MIHGTDEDDIEYDERHDPEMGPSDLSHNELIRKWKKQNQEGAANYKKRKLALLRATGTYNHAGVTYGRAQGFPVIRGVSDRQCDWAAAIREKHHKKLRAKAQRALNAGDKDIVAQTKVNWQICREHVEASWWIENKDYLPGA